MNQAIFGLLTNGVTLMRADFSDHAFERHSHEGFAIGATTYGIHVAQNAARRPVHFVSTSEKNIRVGPFDSLKNSLLRPFRKCTTRLPSFRL